jgi:hypothetical protein
LTREREPAAAVLFPFGDIRACTPQPVQQCTVGPDVVHASTTPATSGQILAKTKVTCSVRNDKMELRIQIQRLVGDRWIDVGTTMVKDGYVVDTTTQTGVARLDRCIDGVYRNGAAATGSTSTVTAGAGGTGNLSMQTPARPVSGAALHPINSSDAQLPAVRG